MPVRWTPCSNCAVNEANVAMNCGHEYCNACMDTLPNCVQCQQGGAQQPPDAAENMLIWGLVCRGCNVRDVSVVMSCHHMSCSSCRDTLMICPHAECGALLGQPLVNLVLIDGSNVANSIEEQLPDSDDEGASRGP